MVEAGDAEVALFFLMRGARHRYHTPLERATPLDR